MTKEKIEALSQYCARLAAKTDVLYSNLEDVVGALSKAVSHMDEIGDVLDKISISLSEAAKAEPAVACDCKTAKHAKTVKKAVVKTAAKVQAKKAAVKKPPAAAEKKETEPKSQTTGVSWDKNRKKWLASYRENGKKIFVGRYDTEDKARQALEAAKKPKKAAVKKAARKSPAKK